ncbi:member of major facilitator multidrug-resistance DHA1 [Wolfiporia cocos MD-104 SS10]|uniref:Member of major facilitator multidrug-resistance DHA1 n=1 Tax=Wolfiporia cocos (strain MD-104) TaxID=742152 RepID=A0A2H3K1M5_WOLCO|nr:member of major facilitator multidrug-resistance DHA1 [Wolfiporia cocos MD-104 SS10]
MTVHDSRSDEETPLLQEERHKKPERTPIPWGQLSILLVLQLAEPLTSQVISPFAPDLIRNIGITGGDEAKVGYYVGLMHSIFFATQAMTVLHWSRLSDRVGRKPVIMTGLFGLSLSMYSFGLSRTFWSLVLSRSLNGALNGNIGVLKSMMAEITDSTNIAAAYAYLPLAWMTGGTLGPMIGGSLSRPTERFPHLFGHNEFLKQYPYFLACAVPATFSAIAFLVTLFFLKETVTLPISIRRILSLRKSKANLTLQNVAGADGPKPVAPITPSKAGAEPLPLRALFIPRVIISAGNYAILAIVDISYRAVLPVYMSTPIVMGGLGLSPQAIGAILSAYGVTNGVLQIMLFSKTIERWGAKKMYMYGITAMLPISALFPIINLVAKEQGYSATVWALLGIQTFLSVPVNFCYGSVFIFITASSPNKASLGSVNGLAQMSVSIMRAIGPALANSMFSLSIDEDHHYLGGMLVYVFLAGLACVALGVGTLLPPKVWTNEEKVSSS